jgi:phosphoglucomutase
MSKKKKLLISSTEKANNWLSIIDDNNDKVKIKKLLDDNDKTNLIEAFHKNLEFGTGGMRGEIGIGSNKINNYTIGLATQGLSNYLKKKLREI